MRRFLIQPFTTARTPPPSGGKAGMPVAYLVAPDQRCTPLDPADPGSRGEREQRLILDSPTQILETFVPAALDVREGDLLRTDGRQYHVRAVAVWRWRSGRFLALLLEDAGLAVELVGGLDLGTDVGVLEAIAVGAL